MQELPLIDPVILYTGERSYPDTLDLFDLFGDHAEIARETLYQPCQLIDLTQLSDETLHQYRFFGAMALRIKHSRNRDILPLLKGPMGALKNLEKEGDITIFTP